MCGWWRSFSSSRDLSLTKEEENEDGLLETKGKLDLLLEERDRVLLKWQSVCWAWYQMGRMWRSTLGDSRTGNEREKDRMKICVTAYNFALLFFFLYFVCMSEPQMWDCVSFISLSKTFSFTFEGYCLSIYFSHYNAVLLTALHLVVLLGLPERWLIVKFMACVTVLMKCFSDNFNRISKLKRFTSDTILPENKFYLFPVFKW
jgi:hypothetical protein